MTVTFLFGTREALTGRSEAYKKSVRRYLEAQGYAQSTDSFVEGSFEDMVFTHPDQPRPSHVEVKADALSLKSKAFGHCLVAYFRRWQARPSRERFRFWLFAQELNSPTGLWTAFFDGNQPIIGDWVRWYNLKGREEEELEISPSDVKVLRQFLRSSEVTVGSNVQLDLATSEKEESSVHSLVRSAETWLDGVNKRRRPQARRSTILLNLAPFELPRTYWQGTIRPEDEAEVTRLVEHAAVPPLYWRKDRRFITFVPLNDENPLSRRLSGPPVAMDFISLQQDRPTLASRLVHSHLADLWAARGLMSDGHTLFFPLLSIEGKTRSVRGPTGNLRQVCKAMFRESDGLHWQKGDLNFVFHEAVEYDISTYWGTTWLELTPKRYYTKDGKEGIKREAAARIDRRFYDPKWDRSPERIARTRLWHFALFDTSSFEKPPPSWASLFKLGSLVERVVPWSPAIAAREQTVLPLEVGERGL